MTCGAVTPCNAVPQQRAALLALSDERDTWLRRLLNAERAAYLAGYAEGRAEACIAIAEMEEWRGSVARWNEWQATVDRIVRADADPSARLTQVMAEIAADQQFAREARRKITHQAGKLSPLEYAVTCRARSERLADIPREAA